MQYTKNVIDNKIVQLPGTNFFPETEFTSSKKSILSLKASDVKILSIKNYRKHVPVQFCCLSYMKPWQILSRR